MSITGNAATMNGATTLRLSASLARETDVGLQAFGGQLVWARAFEVELHVTVLDDVSLTRVADERTGLPVLTAKAAPANTIPAAPPEVVETLRAEPARAEPVRAEAPRAEPPRAEPPRAEPARVDPPRAEPVRAEPPRAAIPLPSPAIPSPPPPAAPLMGSHGGPALPPKPMRPMDAPDVYPDVGDSVMHFHFGECTVVSSDGDRIRLQQEKDGRVREVALAMLKIEAPTTLADGRRHFKLGRKH
ncbi:MAG: hypothetical protein QM820_05440 [Minicystis sp.]